MRILQKFESRGDAVSVAPEATEATNKSPLRSAEQATANILANRE